MTAAPSRADRRRERTRAALVAAAQVLLAEGRTHAAVLEITQLADVGQGTFYNHFTDKAELFDAAVEDALERHGALLDELTASIDDPAVVFAHSLRLTGRLYRLEPELSQVLLNSGLNLILLDHGLGPRALRDIKAGVAVGRFRVADTHVALTAVGGAILALGALLHAEPERDVDAASDVLTADILRMLGLSDDEAARLVALPLPALR
ncbi:MAG: TetR/AcrR family transcriptional regulator [Nocardioides sp.]|uniref:TetR/AcrR family transcriptional regulator n=1 Tax=Nocardioides sp. TaxID=35761 RepID=UPI0039E36593